jgi:hypothetical protein
MLTKSDRPAKGFVMPIDIYIYISMVMPCLMMMYISGIVKSEENEAEYIFSNWAPELD